MPNLLDALPQDLGGVRKQQWQILELEDEMSNALLALGRQEIDAGHDQRIALYEVSLKLQPPGREVNLEFGMAPMNRAIQDGFVGTFGGHRSLHIVWKSGGPEETCSKGIGVLVS